MAAMGYRRWLRCAWCESEATLGRGAEGYLLPACEAHRAEANAACCVVMALRPPRPAAGATTGHAMAIYEHRREVLDRDAAEQARGDLDWTRPVPGWVLFD
jgi:hypothetical protein